MKEPTTSCRRCRRSTGSSSIARAWRSRCCSRPATRSRFRRLKEVLGETDGSLGAHLRRLEDASYVSVRKEFEERKPISWYSLTAEGRAALERHVRGLESLLAELPSGPRGRKETRKEAKSKRRGR